MRSGGSAGSNGSSGGSGSNARTYGVAQRSQLQCLQAPVMHRQESSRNRLIPITPSFALLPICTLCPASQSPLAAQHTPPPAHTPQAILSTHLFLQLLMHELARVLDPIHVDADVVQCLVLLPHLLLHDSLITDIPISPPLRVIPTHIPQRRLPVLRGMRQRLCAAAEAVGCLAAAAAAAAPRLHQLAVPDGWTGWQPRYTAAAGWLAAAAATAAGVALLLATAVGTCALTKAMHGGRRVAP